MDMIKNKPYTQFAVLGLGRFGMGIVQTLSEYDVNIMACDKDELKLRQAAEYATHAVKVDAADENALKKLGIGNFDVVILAFGEDFEASLIAAMIAKESGARRIIVKARNSRQKTILESIGIRDVILPEHEMGEKLARRLVGSNIQRILEDTGLYQITEIQPMDEWVNKTIQQADIRRKHNCTILAIQHEDKLQIPVLPDTMIYDGDVLIALSEKSP